MAETGCTHKSGIWSNIKQCGFIIIIAYLVKELYPRIRLKLLEKKTGLYLGEIESSVIKDIGTAHVE